jgi:hypothetical protein
MMKYKILRILNHPLLIKKKIKLQGHKKEVIYLILIILFNKIF